VIRILALDAPATVADKAARLVADGYRFLKIKIDGDVDLDTARVKAVRDRVGPDITLTADANQTYDRPAALRALHRMEPLGLALLEQPLPASDLAGLASLRGRTAIRIEADESANTLEDVRRLLDAGAVDSINLKISHLGGIRPAAIAAGMCVAAGVAGRMGGGTVGSQLLAAPTLHLLTATPSLVDPSEVAEFMRLADDPASGLRVHDGVIDIPDGPGLGVEVAFDGAA
jgi:L-alanine-DL-glutamate epimerase-like enolase superfamily enzyme